MPLRESANLSFRFSFPHFLPDGQHFLITGRSPSGESGAYLASLDGKEARLLSKAGGKQLGLLLFKPNTGDLNVMKELIAAGKVVPVIDRQYTLEQASEALRHVGEGRARGKVVITF